MSEEKVALLMPEVYWRYKDIVLEEARILGYDKIHLVKNLGEKPIEIIEVNQKEQL